MKYKNLIIYLSILFTIILIGCENFSNNPSTKTSTKQDNTYYYPYIGTECSKEQSISKAFLTIVENSQDARPQSGLSDADIIFETSAEGGIPRFICLFQSKNPNCIGPIRSTRAYFNDISHFTNLPYAHCGGSEEALNQISSDSSLMSINEISNGSYFWRDNSRNAPHNLYTSSENILNAIKDKGWKYENTPIFTFDDMKKKNTYENANNIFITSSSVYSTNYVYSNDKYIKYMDNEIAIDKNTNSNLTFNNIIIQKTNITTQDDNSHLTIPLTGIGDGYIFREGKIINMHWSRASENDPIIFYDDNNKKISLSKGNTIWHIIDNNTKIEARE